MGETAEAEFCFEYVSWVQYDLHLFAKGSVEYGVFPDLKFCSLYQSGLFISRILI